MQHMEVSLFKKKSLGETQFLTPALDSNAGLWEKEESVDDREEQ